MTEGLFLSQADSRPMYLQIVEQIKLKILAGDWPSGHPLPSIRELAADTKVSVITIKRAYAELELEEFIVTQAGRGSFVAKAREVLTDMRQVELDKNIEALLDTAKRLGLSHSALVDRVRKLINQREQS